MGMMENWFAVALLSPALFALVTLADDNLVRKVYKSPEFGAIVSGFFALIPLLLLPFYPIALPPIPIMLLAMLAGFLTINYYLLYFKALLVESPSIVITLFQMSRAIVPFLAYIFLGELLSKGEYAGFLMIFTAAVGISAIDIKKFRFSKAFPLIVVAASITAVIAILDKMVYKQVQFWDGYIFFCVGMGLGAFVLTRVTAEGKKFYGQFFSKFKSFIILFLLTELLNIGAEMSLGYAISQGPVSLVKVIEGIQPFFVLFFAILLYPFLPQYFREAAEKNLTRKILFMMLMLLGLYIISAY
jgi:drug/metabolite transporter (DMT)-like permease